MGTKSFTHGGSCEFGIANGQACCASTCGKCGGKDCGKRPGGGNDCCHGGVVGTKNKRPKGAKLCRDTNGVGPCIISDEFFVIQWDQVPLFCDPKKPPSGGCPKGTSTFEVILHQSGAIKFLYKQITYHQSLNKYAMPVSGIENAAGNEGQVLSQCHGGFDSLQCDRAKQAILAGRKSAAYLLAESCGSNPRAFSIGWCPGYNKHVGSKPQEGSKGCNFQQAEDFCQTEYGGQLASITTQAEYDTLAAMLPTAVGEEQFLVGLHQVANKGKWYYSDNTVCDDKCMSFLKAHSNDGIRGTNEHNVVFTPSRAKAGKGFDDCCMAKSGNWKSIEGFVCEAYTAPGQIVIATGRNWQDANNFCKRTYGGTLMSIHNQRDYDKLAKLVRGYTKPVMIGLHSDGKGHWTWADRSRVDMTFLKAHSFDGLQGTTETVGAFYPPICELGWDNGIHQKNHGKKQDTCKGDRQDPNHFNHALHDFGAGTVGAFACKASGNPVVMRETPKSNGH